VEFNLQGISSNFLKKKDKEKRRKDFIYIPQTPRMKKAQSKNYNNKQ